MSRLTEEARRMLAGPNFGYLATLMADGWPHVSPMWCDTDGTNVLVNTAEGRHKAANMRRDPRVAITVTERDDPYAKVDIRGRVVEISDGPEAEEHIHGLSRKYFGRPFKLRPGERRLLVRIEPVAIERR